MAITVSSGGHPGSVQRSSVTRIEALSGRLKVAATFVLISAIRTGEGRVRTEKMSSASVTSLDASPLAIYDNETTISVNVMAFHVLTPLPSMNASFFGLALLLGLRHGMDADHLAAIDGLTRVRNNPWNGVLFALGHGLIVTLLAAGVVRLSTVWIGQLSPLLLITIGTLNLYRLLRRSASHGHYRVFTSSPVLLGIVFAAGFETASQLSALTLADPVNAWLLGSTFSLGMMIVDGIDGYNAFVVQRAGNANSKRGERASSALSFLVVAASYGLAVAEWKRIDMDHLFLPLGISLFVSVLCLRIWSRLPVRAAKEARSVPAS